LPLVGVPFSPHEWNFSFFKCRNLNARQLDFILILYLMSLSMFLYQTLASWYVKSPPIVNKM
jgi:hypothetical protein